MRRDWISQDIEYKSWYIVLQFTSLFDKATFVVEYTILAALLEN